VAGYSDIEIDNEEEAQMSIEGCIWLGIATFGAIMTILILGLFDQEEEE
jgi:hypothetical protein